VDVIQSFSVNDFLESNVDPFRFSFNAELWGLKQAVRKEIEHKIEMKLENMFGDFHEDYLGNTIHTPSDTKWVIVPSGVMPGVDIGNYKMEYYLQIKSKHNSMNSSSAKRLAQELRELSEEKPRAIFGCGFVIAGPSKKAIGEDGIAAVARVFKGKDLYSFVTGNPREMNEVIIDFPTFLKEVKKGYDFNKMLDEASGKVIKGLEMYANSQGISIQEYLYKQAVR